MLIYVQIKKCSWYVQFKLVVWCGIESRALQKRHHGEEVETRPPSLFMLMVKRADAGDLGEVMLRSLVEGTAYGPWMAWGPEANTEEVGELEHG